MKHAFIFPGQGSQYVGMGKEVYTSFPEAREVFEEVDNALNQKLSHIIFEGPIEELTSTENTQPALMATSIALLRVLTKQCNKTVPGMASFVAGHSLGEYSALVAAGSLTLADAALLLRIRGNAMKEAVPHGHGGMAAVIGVDMQAAEKIVAQAAGESGNILQIANDNAPGQIVISGNNAAIEAAEKIARDMGAKRYIALNVSTPFHCDLMKPAATVMKAALAEIDIKTPSIALVSNVTANQTTDPELIRQYLVEQVANRVRWTETIEYMNKNGVGMTVEIGAGKVLSGLTKRIAHNMRAASLQTPQDIENFCSSF